MPRPGRLAALAVFTFAPLSGLHAQGGATLTPGARVRITVDDPSAVYNPLTARLLRLEGSYVFFRPWADGELGAPRSMPAGDISRLEVSLGERNRPWVGAAVGGAVGFTFGWLFTHIRSKRSIRVPPSRVSPDDLPEIGLAVGAVFGFVTGRLVTVEKWQGVWRR